MGNRVYFHLYRNIAVSLDISVPFYRHYEPTR